MAMTRQKNQAASTEQLKPYVLKLYVTGATRRSEKAIRNLNSICEEYLKGRYDLQVVDLYQSPLRAEEAQVLATPTLVKQLPMPVRRLIGDLSQRGRVLMLLDLKPKGGDVDKTQTSSR